MAFNKNKSLNKAQKLLQKGKLADAVKEYRSIIENDPDDIRILKKTGDLQAKLGDIEAANDTYRKVADHYSKDGFFLKAVAVYKQILKLDPGLIAIYVRLAELYQQLGLNSEAMKQYQVVVKHYETQGLKKESLDILRKMAELDPENTANKIKLAELYVKEGHGEAATEQLQTVAQDLRSRESWQDLSRVLEKMENLGVADHATRLELSEIYLRTAEPKRALAKLQELFEENPKDAKVLELLARSFLDLQQPEKAQSVYNELAGVLQEAGQLEERERIIGKIKSLGGSVDDTADASSSVDDIPIEDVSLDDLEEGLVDAEEVVEEAAPEEASVEESSPAPVQAESSVEDSEDVVKTLGEIDVFVKYGLLDKACQTLSELVAAHPESETVRNKLVETFENKGDPAGLQAALKTALASAEERGSQGAISAINQLLGSASGAPAPPSEDQFEQEVEIALDEGIDLEMVDDGAAGQSQSDEDPELGDLVQASSEEDQPAQEIPDVELEGDFEREEYTAVRSQMPDLAEAGDEAESEVSEERSPRADGSEFGFELESGVEEEAPASEVDLEIGLESEEPAEEPQISLDAQPEVEAEIDLGASEDVESPDPMVEADAEPDAQAEPEAPQEDSPVSEEPVEEELQVAASSTDFSEEIDEAEFFIQEGLVEEAEDILRGVLEKDPNHVKTQELLSQITEAKSPEAESSAAMASEKERESIEAPQPKMQSSSERILKEKENQESDLGEAFFDLSSELQEEIKDLEDNLSKQTEEAEDEDYLSPEEVIAEFKKGVARTVSREDYQTHYNLGIAYKEMGLLNEAIAEFELASEDGKVSTDCVSMIGLCLISKKDYEAAIDVYRKGLARISPSAVEALGLNYELAEAYVGHGNLGDAYKLFARISDIDPTFRDVRRRAKELELDLGDAAPSPSEPERPKAQENEDEENEAKKKTKISYI